MKKMAPLKLPLDHGEEPQGHDDMFSELPDHILLCILEKFPGDDVRSLARTCVLSKRWRALFPPPLMLPELEITARTFVPAADGSGMVQLLHQATESFTAALRFFLAGGGEHQRRAIIETLRLELYLIKPNYLLDACHLVAGAIDRGEVRGLELVVLTGTPPFVWDAATAPENVRVGRFFAGRFMRLLAAAAIFASSLRALTLENLLFRSPSDVGTLLGTCAALENLTLDSCGFADLWSVLTIDAPPSSRLKELYLENLHAGGVRLVHAPRLEWLVCSEWMAASCPVTFGPGSAPCLEDMTLNNRAATWQSRFCLSELLQNAPPLQALRLGFTNDKIWVQPESPKALGPAFSKLQMLHLLNVFPERDLSWTMFLLQAAPLLESVHIEVSHNHACSEFKPDYQREILDRLKWEVPPGFRHHHLRELHVGGGIDAGKKFVGFARLVVVRAVSLELLVLDGRVTCEECVAAQLQDPSVVLSRFPEDEGDVDVMVNRIMDGISRCARIIVYSASNWAYEYRSNKS
ncbi:unnamed protein product [Urochloa decumbens]|uniref:F-box domain-containing protein n=1 Tax=Urochloa decumbens TaxID=240449 RepID=A0ABC9FQ27_9POAL